MHAYGWQALYQRGTILSRRSRDVNALHGDASPCQIIRNRLSIYHISVLSSPCTLACLLTFRRALLVVAINQALNSQTLYTCDERSQPWVRAETKLVPREGRVRKTTRHLQQIFRDRSVFYGVAPRQEETGL